MLERYKYFLRTELVVLTLMSVFLLGTPVDAKSALPAGMKSKEVTITKKVNMYDSPENAISRELEKHNNENETIDRSIGYITTSGPNNSSSDFRFNGSVQVVLANGQKISMRKLRTPCVAKLYYYPNRKKSAVLHKIVVRRILSGANTAWSPDYEK